MAEVNTITARKGHIQALAFAAKGGSALSDLLYQIAKTKQAERLGPIQAMLFLETHFTDEEGANIPEVGSQEGKTGNKPFDRYTAKVKTADGERSIPGSWFTDVVKSTDAWLRLNEEKEWLKQGQGEGVPAHIIAMSTSQRALRLEEINIFIKDMRTGLTKGAMLFHQCAAISAMNPARVKVKLPIMTQKNESGDAVQVVTGSLIRLTDPSGMVEEDEVMSVTSFNQLDADKASKADDKGSITSLKATAHRAPKGAGKGKGTATAPTIPSNIETVLTYFNVLASAFGDVDSKMQAALLSKCAVDGPEGDEAVLSAGKLCLALDYVWTQINGRYNAINARKAAALNVRPEPLKAGNVA